MSSLGELVFIGLGLNSEKSISLLGIEKARKADSVFIELYTSLMPELDIRKLEELVRKQVHIVSRRDLEEDSGRRIQNSGICCPNEARVCREEKAITYDDPFQLE